MHRSLGPLILSLAALASGWMPAATAAEATPAAETSDGEDAFRDALRRLDWVEGPTKVEVSGNSELVVPEGYLFLDTRNTDKYLELTQNFPSGREVMIAPANLRWAAYLSFDAEGYVKDDEKIDAPELLKTLKQGSEESNSERRKRGWAEMHVLDWAVAPAYNADTKRLEWATLLESDGSKYVNFSTKVLGRRGHTSVILVSAPEGLAPARPELEQVLRGYTFNSGERYADFQPGDKVAEYGLAALVLGGAAAIATKKGLWAVIGAFLVTKIKFVLAGLVALGAGARKLLSKNKA